MYLAYAQLKIIEKEMKKENQKSLLSKPRRRVLSKKLQEDISHVGDAVYTVLMRELDDARAQYERDRC